MKNGGGVLRLLVIAVLSLCIISCGAYGVLFRPASAEIFFPASGVSPEDVQDISGQSIPAAASGEADDKAPSEDENAESQSGSSAAVSAGSVEGKIIEKHISPYSAGTSYNGVYLKNSTGLEINLKKLLDSPPEIKLKSNDTPQVLIVHTHTTESFMTEKRDYYTSADTSRRLDENLNVVKLGAVIADSLNSAGIVTVHDKTKHDYPNYTGSYSRSAKTIRENLKKYPGIKIVLDIHRDAVSEEGGGRLKLTTEVDGKKAAQVMLVCGSQSGTITGFPNWEKNLRLAVRLQQTFEKMYPALARPINFVSREYNQSITSGSLLLEIGMDGNTVEEVTYSAELTAKALVSLLNTMK